MRPWLAALVGALLVAAPEAARACSVCFSATDQSRVAFLLTTGILTLLPLALVGGAVWWLRREIRRRDAQTARSSSIAANK